MSKLPASLMELRFHICPRSPASQGLKSLIVNRYPKMKAQNSRLPILIRESENATPKIFARFQKGVEKSVSVGGLKETEIVDLFNKLVAEEKTKTLE